MAAQNLKKRARRPSARADVGRRCRGENAHVDARIGRSRAPPDAAALNEGDRLDFELEVDRRGKYAAVNLQTKAD